MTAKKLHLQKAAQRPNKLGPSLHRAQGARAERLWRLVFCGGKSLKSTRPWCPLTVSSAFSQWLAQARAKLGRTPAHPAAPLTDLQQARALLAAIDAGGVPLYPGKVNAIARALGLEVSSKAPVDETIARLREAVSRGT